MCPILLVQVPLVPSAKEFLFLGIWHPSSSAASPTLRSGEDHIYPIAFNNYLDADWLAVTPPILNALNDPTLADVG
jgi:hypothetical protein